MPFPAVINVTELDGTNGFMINGTTLGGLLGYFSYNAGDINGDGIADMIIGAPGWPGVNNGIIGTAYIIFGSHERFAGQFNISSINGTNGFIVQSSTKADFTGGALGNAGDINGDGINDIILGSPLANSEAGQAYVVFGSRTAFPPILSLNTTYLDGNGGFIIGGLPAPAGLGASVAGIEDINADGIADIAVSATYLNSYTGEVYTIFGSANGFNASIDITQLKKQGLGFSITGIEADSSFGHSICGLNDVNGDGIDDLIIGADGAGTANNTFPGAGYIIFGSRNFLTEPPSLPLNGTNGFTLNGESQGALIGSSVNSAGDINGDGINDLIIGAPGYSTAENGVIYIVFGSRNPFKASIMLTNLNGTDGFIIPGIEIDNSKYGSAAGFSVNGAGDINGDGLDDIIIGAPHVANVSGAGYVLFGSRDSFPSIFNLTSLNGTNGFSITGMPTNSNLGNSVSGIGDINADGIDDILIGAPTAYDKTGAAYVIFGQAPIPTATCSSTFDLFSLDGSNGFAVTNYPAGYYSYHSTSGIGDINGDGLDDIAIGISTAPYSSTQGLVCVILGSAEKFQPNISLTNPTDYNGFVIQGPTGYGLGISVAAAGDVNLDGFDDLVAGSFTIQDTDGGSYIIFGQATFSSPLSLPIDEGVNPENPALSFLFVSDSADNAGSYVAGAGDFNGDGINDFILGGPTADTDAGVSYIVFGSLDYTAWSPQLQSLNGANGFIITGASPGEGALGQAVAEIGNFNGDRYDDIAIGAPERNNATGRVYIVFGRQEMAEATIPADEIGTNGLGFYIDGINQGSNFGFSVGSAGDFNGDGLSDLTIGAYSDADNAGTVYVIFGNATKNAFIQGFNLEAINGQNGFVITGLENSDNTGWSVSGAGDVNGDGLDDMIIGAPMAPSGEGDGAAYVIYGSRKVLSNKLNLNSLNGENGYAINGIVDNANIGACVASAGDINGDGLQDIIINNSYQGKEGNGVTYVIFGSRCNPASPSPTASITPSNTVTSSTTPPFSATPSLIPTGVLSSSISGTPTSSSSNVPPSNTPTPSLIPSRTTQPTFSPSSSSGNSNSLLPLFIAAPIGAFMLLFLVCGLYLHKKRASQNRYGFFSSEGVEPIPEAGEEVQLQATGRQMESYSSINQGDAELLETVEGSRKSNCAVM